MKKYLSAIQSKNSILQTLYRSFISTQSFKVAAETNPSNIQLLGTLDAIKPRNILRAVDFPKSVNNNLQTVAFEDNSIY